MPQEIGRLGLDLKTVNGPYEDRQRLLGELVAAIRVDTPPTGEATRIADDGGLYPLTVDKNGCLWVRVAGNTDSEGVSDQLLVLREMRDLMAEVRDLLLKIA